VASFDKPSVRVMPADLSRSLSWETGQLNFLNEPLESAVERMNRYSRERLVVGDREVATFRINGVFTAGDTEAFVEGVATFFPVDVIRQPGKLVLKSTLPEKK